MKNTVIKKLIIDLKEIDKRDVHLTNKGFITMLENCVLEEKEQIITDNSSNKIEQLDRFTLEYLLNGSLYDKIKQSNTYFMLKIFISIND